MISKEVLAVNFERADSLKGDFQELNDKEIKIEIKKA